jgi:hypothetical protein
MVAITVDLKTKGLVLPLGASLQCRAFMKFRGPKALNDKLPISRAGTTTECLSNHGQSTIVSLVLGLSNADLGLVLVFAALETSSLRRLTHLPYS